jgi:penicillin amidase
MVAPHRRRLRRALAVTALAIVGCAAAAGLYVRHQLRASLPHLDGEVPLEGLTAGVTIDRDIYGIPTITAGSRADAARALGFLHAQERFFQMDLQRRQAAGELAALLGPRALPADRAARVHRMRRVAQQALVKATAASRDLLDAYAAGVNAGLAALDGPPFEYVLLGLGPAPWLPEDSGLTVLAMFNTLQGRQAAFERTLGTMYDALPRPLYEFLAARGSEWDAPVMGERFFRPAVPGADVIDLRTWKPGRHANTARGSTEEHGRDMSDTGTYVAVFPCLSVSERLCGMEAEEAAAIGSNNWAVSGRHTATGAAIVANDMHLAINVPNIWYRAVMTVTSPASPTAALRLAGITLPGLPGLTVGSNGHVAWGFTNSGGDWSDLVIVEPDSRMPGHYVTPDGPVAFDEIEEIIEVAGAPAETARIRWTIWGPIIGRDHRDRLLAQRWIAHDAGVLASDLIGPEQSRSVTEAIARFAGLGIPAQNLVVGDRDGHIGWTIAGPIPRRRGHDGARPTSWADGTHGWDGYLDTSAYPRIVDPEVGRIWTANAPVVGGAMLATIGEGGYADGIRARLIRDRILGLEHVAPRDMLAVQLDDSALFLERWRQLALSLLAVEAASPAGRTEFRRLVESTWTGRASTDSVAYRLVRTFRQAMQREVTETINELVREVDPEFDFGRANRAEGPLWSLVTERPVHLLPSRHSSWEAWMLAVIDQTIAELSTEGRALSTATWGAYNRATVEHPLAAGLSVAGRWLRMPGDALPGDIYTPRAHSPRAGPSQRLVVSPGHEADGIAHMPGGQSGHPLSAHFGDQHAAWVEGRTLPFLPGETRHRLVLVPRSPIHPFTR